MAELSFEVTCSGIDVINFVFFDILTVSSSADYRFIWFRWISGLTLWAAKFLISARWTLLWVQLEYCVTYEHLIYSGTIHFVLWRSYLIILRFLFLESIIITLVRAHLRLELLLKLTRFCLSTNHIQIFTVGPFYKWIPRWIKSFASSDLISWRVWKISRATQNSVNCASYPCSLRRADWRWVRVSEFFLT